MDISDNTDAPSDGRPPIEAVAATAAESSKPAGFEDVIDDRKWSAPTEHVQGDQDATPKQQPGPVEEVSKDDNMADKTNNDAEKSGPQGRSALSDLHNADSATQFNGKLRKKWWQVYLPKNPPPPPPASLDDAKIIPLAQINFLNELLYIWISPIIKLGKRRPLQATDLWKMDDPRTANVLAAKFQKAYARRSKAAQEYNKRLDAGDIKPSFVRKAYWSASRGSAKDKREKWLQKRRRKANIVWCLTETVGLFFWGGGISKVIGDMAQLCSPLVSKNLIQFAQARAAAEASGLPGPGIGRGVGDAFGLTLLIMMGSIFQHFFFYRSTASGCLLRAALSTTVYQKALTISNQSRVTFNNGRLMAHLSTDISRIDYATQWIHALWTAPIQIIVCAILLILQIGPSALVGLALFAFLIPLQSKIMTWSVNVRKKSMVWTDARSRTLQEVLGSFAILKYFVFEQAYLKRISDIRVKELLGIRKLSLIKAANQALALSLPSLAAVVSFIVYTGLGNDIEPAKIFTSLSLFNLLRQPLMFLPRALSAAADATNALHRLEELLEADLRSDEERVDRNLNVAIKAVNATFEWMTANTEELGEVGIKKSAKSNKSKNRKEADLHDGDSTPKQQEPFKIPLLNIEVPRGKLVAIVGSVGSGKSSILSGLIGEMKQTSGTVKFGGKIAYCAQHAFIQNATLRDNVLFGQPWDEERYWRVIEDACLIPDCLQLPDGDLTEIGERGINISGGQKQRVNVARALYYDAEIILLDDPLSALDAHVGQALFETFSRCIRDQGKTVVLVTHALHVLPHVDYIYTVDNGSIVEQGTYAELSDEKGAFAALMVEFGGQRHEDKVEEIISDDVDDIAVPERVGLERRNTAAQSKAQAYDKSAAKLAAGTGKLEGRLVQQEKRNTGTIKSDVYKQYFTAGKGWLTIPLILASVLLTQAGQILTGLWLTYWENNSFNQPLGFYIGMYGMIGATQAIFLFLMGGFVSLLTYFASVKLHARSMKKIFFAPMSFFHSTPTGRLMNVFGKDVDVLDSLLSDSIRMTIMILGTVFGSVIIIAVFFPYFLIAVGVIIFGYAYFWGLYRRSSRELKRMDSILRSLLYGHFSESLAGMSTIRAYGESNRFMAENSKYMDLEDRAYFLTSVNSRWLAIRVDALGAIMVLAVALMAANGINGVSASEVALTLTYCVTMLQSFGMVTRQAAETENNMNAVERLTYYSSDTLPQEAPHEVPSKKPSPTWPDRGEIILDEIEMAYRPELPSVLKKISLHIMPSEKVGICGRTGSGKSSIMAALFRMVELRSGSITIDGVDVSQIGLSDLRSHMAIIPQDPQLFSGTIRSNLDPFSQYDDARLNDALRRSYLLEDLDNPEGASHINLDTQVEDGGENLSMGQQSLVALARALVRDCKIIILDEASASLDLETDSKIQETITTEFHDRTLLCIAHRLRTVIAYDRILVLESGEVLEFDDPITLFRKGGAFHAMCIRSSITEADIIKAQSSRNRK